LSPLEENFKKSLMSFYRKYRPQNFDSFVGQEHIKETLVNALKLDRVSHAYLFAGPRGTGKTSTARILAKAVNCTNLKDATPCEQCEICTDINDGRLIDVIEIDAASNRGIDEMRDLKEKINFAPTRAKNKVYIIDEVHMLTKEAFNALLKTLEEPPTHTYFILATTEVHKIPETILSRCQRFDFKRISDSVIADRLKFIADSEKIETEQTALDVIAHVSQGGMRDAIGLMEQLTHENKLTYEHVSSALGLSGFASIEKLFGFLTRKETGLALTEIHNLYSEGHDLTQFNKSFLEFLRKKMLSSVDDGKTADTSFVLKLINFFQQAYDGAKFAVIPQLPLEIAIIESCMEGKVEVAQVVVATPVVAAVAKTVTSQPVAAAAPSAPAKAVPTAMPVAVKVETDSVATHVKTAPVAAPAVSPAPASEDSSQRIHQSIKSVVATPVLSFDEVKAAWPKIVKNIKSTVTKRSFPEAFLVAVEGNTVKIAFTANFHLDKVMEPANRVELEDVFSNILGTSIKIIAEISKTAPVKNSENQQAAEKIAEIFEGEVL
jgi:DNA polymerase-3 subunit gamma/tau